MGQKSALRYVLALMKWSNDRTQLMSKDLMNLRTMGKCPSCFMVAKDNVICNLCSSNKRQERGTICVVESIVDLMAIEKTGQYFGLYYVLEGVLNPLLGIGPDEINLASFVERVQKDFKIKEIILALPPSVEGDITSSYLRDKIPESIMVRRIGLGIPMGGSLEYLDPLTISKALENSKSF